MVSVLFNEPTYVASKRLLGAISKRAAETVLDEMSFMGTVKLRAIEAAQTRLIEVVRRLEEDGEIELELKPESGS